MKITNIEEFDKLFDFIFSSNFKNLKSKEKTVLKEEIALAVNEVDGAKEKMKTIFESELKNIRFNSYSQKFEKDIEMFLYVYNTFSEDEKIELITKVITGLNNKRYYFDIETVFVLLDSLPNEKKIMLLSKFEMCRLLNIMSSCNESACKKNQKIINRFYYKYYYNICQKAMKLKELK